jgi:nitrate reductase NapE component
MLYSFNVQAKTNLVAYSQPKQSKKAEFETSNKVSKLHIFRFLDHILYFVLALAILLLGI